MAATGNRLVIFLHSGEYDRMHQGLSVAACGAALGRPVEIYFFWWALDRLIRGELDLPSALGSGARGEELAEEFAARGAPTLRQLLEAARSTGCTRLLACSGSLAILGHSPRAIVDKVDELIGWAGILDRTAGVADRFYL